MDSASIELLSGFEGYCVALVGAGTIVGDCVELMGIINGSRVDGTSVGLCVALTGIIGANVEEFIGIIEGAGVGTITGLCVELLSIVAGVSVELVGVIVGTCVELLRGRVAGACDGVKVVVSEGPSVAFTGVKAPGAFVGVGVTISVGEIVTLLKVIGTSDAAGSSPVGVCVGVVMMAWSSSILGASVIGCILLAKVGAFVCLPSILGQPLLLEGDLLLIVWIFVNFFALDMPLSEFICFFTKYWVDRMLLLMEDFMLG